jgi:hypothetical protein
MVAAVLAAAGYGTACGAVVRMMGLAHHLSDRSTRSNLFPERLLGMVAAVLAAAG